MPLVKDGKIVADEWRLLGDDEALPEAAPVIVSLKRWTAAREALLARGGRLGVALANTDDVAALAGDFARLGLVALSFPKLGDGRAYSQARLVRERYGFAGELRATGKVLRDELFFMWRCGFDAFETDERGAAGFAAAMREFSLAYQPAARNAGLRLRLRGRAAPDAA